MISLTLRTLFKNKVLWAWPILFLLFVLAVFYWGGVSSAQNSYSFTLVMGGANIPSSMVIPQLTSFVVLLSIIGFPSHFSKNLKPERGSLLLSKPISRTELFFSDFAAMLTVAFSYTLVSIILLAVLVGFEAGIFPVQFFIALLLFLPLLLLTYYITIVLFLILTNSYLAGALLGWIVTGFSSIFFNIEQFMKIFGFDSDFAYGVIDVLSFLIPSAGGVEQLLEQVYSGGFAAFDGGLFAFILASCLPFGILSYYLYLNKEF